MLNGIEWGNSIWTDFRDKWAGETYLGSYSAGSFMPDWSLVYGSGTATADIIAIPGAISGQAFRHANTESVGSVDMYRWDTLPTAVNMDVLMGGFVLQANDTSEKIVGPLATLSASSTFNGAYLNASDVLGDEFRIWSQNGGVPSVASLSAPWAPLVWYWFRINVNGSTIRAKYWQRGSTEPSGWTLTLPSGTAPSAPGRAGVIMSAEVTLGGPSSHYIDFFSVCMDGNPAWGPV